MNLPSALTCSMKENRFETGDPSKIRLLRRLDASNRNQAHAGYILLSSLIFDQGSCVTRSRLVQHRDKSSSPSSPSFDKASRPHSDTSVVICLSRRQLHKLQEDDFYLELWSIIYFEDTDFTPVS